MNDDVLMMVDIIASLVINKLMGDGVDEGEERSSPQPSRETHIVL